MTIVFFTGLRTRSTYAKNLEDELHKTSVQLKGAKDTLSKSFSKSHVDEIIVEKDTQITGLMEEGEKLSKQQLTLNTTIKKLRTRVKESEDKLKTLEEKHKKTEETLTKKSDDLTSLQVIFCHFLVADQI